MAMTAVVGLLAVPASAQEAPAPQSSCKAVHADLVEVRSTVGCKPEHAFCFLGEVDGNHGLRGTTYFRGDASALFPSAAPTFRSYTGSFEYTTDRGTLTMREMGLTEPPGIIPESSGVVNAYQTIVASTGEFAGATGYLFVSGFNRNQRIVTTVRGEICRPAHDAVMAVDVRTSAVGFEWSAPRTLFNIPHLQNVPRGFTVTADGQRFIAVVATAGAEPQRFTTLLNWTSLVK
jgi:hypothetical protein